MTRTKRLCAVVVICWAGAVMARQPLASLALPDPLRDHVKDERYGIVTSLRGLPLGVRESLQTLFGTQTLDIADPFDSRSLAQAKPPDSRAATGAAATPTRRMIAAGCADDNHCIVYYERAGSAPSWHVAMFHWQPESTRFEWGGIAPSGLKSIEDVRKAMLTGAIKGPSKVW